jgi:hypothetical protein
VRVIVRRPHAYFFIEDTFEDRGGIGSATPQGCQLADGSFAPLPGIYFLDEDGKHVTNTGLTSTDDLLKAMAKARVD